MQQDRMTQTLEGKSRMRGFTDENTIDLDFGLTSIGPIQKSQKKKHRSTNIQANHLKKGQAKSQNQNNKQI